MGVEQYGRNADQAAQKLIDLGIDQIKINELRDVLNEALVRIEANMREQMKVLFPTEESWDSVEYSDGERSALAWAKQQGIENPVILSAIREFGFHHASLKIQLHLDEFSGADFDSDFDNEV